MEKRVSVDVGRTATGYVFKSCSLGRGDHRIPPGLRCSDCQNAGYEDFIVIEVVTRCDVEGGNRGGDR